MPPIKQCLEPALKFGKTVQQFRLHFTFGNGINGGYIEYPLITKQQKSFWNDQTQHKWESLIIPMIFML